MNDIAYIVKNKLAIIQEKKSIPKMADVATYLEKIEEAEKAFLYENGDGVVKRTIVANTYLWKDSHDDVHMPGLFSKSIQERGTRIPHLHDHEFKMSARVGRLLSISEQPMKWTELGVQKKGTTTVLLAESQIEKELNSSIYKEYLTDSVDQHSVAMQYVKMDLAVNDDEYSEEFKVWQSVFPQLGNPEEAEKDGYFWVVREAKLIEISAVLLGSNVLTPTLIPQPPKGTDKTEPKMLNINEILTYYKI
jgi:hypothetical protein